MVFYKFSAALLATLLLLATSVTSFADELNYNIVELDISVQADIANDLMKVVLETKHQAASSKEVANRVNQDMAWALLQIKNRDFIDAKTGNYSTNPIYTNKRISGWAATQQLIISSEDFSQTAEIIAVLQEKLNVQQMSFTAKKSSRDVLHNQLLGKAIAAFREKATLIKQAMVARDYQVVDFAINQHQSQPPVRRFRESMAMDMKAMSTPALQGGDSEVSVSIRGRIQLQF